LTLITSFGIALLLLAESIFGRGFYRVFYVTDLAIYAYFGKLTDAGSLIYRLLLNICQIFVFFSEVDSGGFIALVERSDETYKFYNLKGYGFAVFSYFISGVSTFVSSFLT
jgi:hypothetical protein